jgi:pimeloyl-ACP methyl ester carboxylesterase/DNA-binding CsgD family transcriptional regulator
VHGRGPPLVRVATWLTHLDYDWQSPVWRHWLTGLAESHTVVRYDERGCGLSGRDPGELSLDAWVGDLETVVDAAGLDRFALLGVSQGAAVAVAFAARHPERVERLVLYGGFVRGRRLRSPRERAHEEALVAAIRAGWAESQPAFRRVFSMMFLPEGTPEQMAWYDELQRESTTAATAARLVEARGGIDVTDLAPSVDAPTLVMHARRDRVVPADQAPALAGLIPNARMVLLDSANHILLADEPAWPTFLSELRTFLRPAAGASAPRSLDELSPRELDVLEHVAAGLTNEEIAERLHLSVRTVERHMTNVYVKLGVSGAAGRAAAAADFARLRADRQHGSP